MPNRNLYHESVELIKLDGTQICKLNSPFFEKDDLADIVKKVLQYSENFMVIGYNEGRREEMIREAVEFYEAMEAKNENMKRKEELDPVKCRKNEDEYNELS